MTRFTSSISLSARDIVTTLHTVYAGVIAVGISYLIGFATQMEMLLVAALPLGALLVISLAWLPPRAQLFAWAATTAWLLSSVYLGVSEIEWVMLVVVFFAAIAGSLWNPWFIAAIWFIHPLWDLIPRELPDLQHDLPLACLIYDLVVAVYLAWRIRTGFFDGAVGRPTTPARFINTGLSRTITALVIGSALAVEIFLVAMISMEPSSVWFAAPVAVALVAATLALPHDARRVFWVVFTIWTGMSFAHSGEPLELAVFAVMIALAVVGFTKSPYFWAIAWGFHALWNFFPRAHDMSPSSALMGHWMYPLAGFAFEATIAVYLALSAMQANKTR